jgi:diamine N-acetyltransferase
VTAVGVQAATEGAGSPPVTLREITDENRAAVTALRVGPGQNRFVATVAKSFDDADATPEGNPWYRAIYARDEPVGFIMLGWNVIPQPGMLGPWFLWRLLVDERYQRRGYGRKALELAIELISAQGAVDLLTSYVDEEGGPWPFYEKLGFRPTGEIDDGEVVIRLDLTTR